MKIRNLGPVVEVSKFNSIPAVQRGPTPSEVKSLKASMAPNDWKFYINSKDGIAENKRHRIPMNGRFSYEVPGRNTPR